MMKWIGRIIGWLAMIPFIPSAAMKLSMAAQVQEGMAHFGFPETLIQPLGVLESACVLIYLIPRTSVLGAILLTGYLGGAIVTHLRVGEPVYIQVALGVVIWLSLFIQDPKIRELIPLKHKT